MKIIKYQDKYKNAFIQLNLAWIERFYRVEESDINMLEHIDDHIQNGVLQIKVKHQNEKSPAKFARPKKGATNQTGEKVPHRPR